MKLDDLLRPLIHYKKIGTGNPEIRSLEMDSRFVKDGSLFICMKGYTVDGHDFVQEAAANGASAILAEREVAAGVPVVVVKDTRRAMAILASHFYGHPTEKLTLIGVTGTNGKTTTTHLIEKMMNDYGKKTGLIGTLYIKIGNQTYETKNTTPESLVLQKYFFEMVKEHVDTAIMEVSSHALHLGRVRGCNFNIAVFTNLTPDHLDYHETMEAYKQAKGLLFSQLGNTYKKGELKAAILNADDPASKEYERMTAAQTITYGIDNESDFMAKNIRLTPKGTSFTLQAFSKTIDIDMKLVGKFSVYNALAALAAGYVYGIPLESMKKSLQSMEGVAGRFETISLGQPYAVIVDYAHTPDSLENVLKTVRQFTQGKVFCVVGCGGDRDKTKRPLMAQIATEAADFAFFTSDNPRSENPVDIIKDMEKGVNKNNYTVIVDRKEAIAAAIQKAKKDDAVIIAGKGHETYQIIGSRVYDFDDREVAREAIRRDLENDNTGKACGRN